MNSPLPAESRSSHGVSHALKEYVQSPEIADDYDDFFAFNQLFEFDEQIISEEVQPPGTVVDLGVGTGRSLLPLLRRGLHAVAVDLSAHMLELTREKVELEGLEVDCLRANLPQLDALDENIADYCLCMFSTLGMIQQRAFRRQALRHARRILKPDGKLILHAHNYWVSLFSPGGLRWLTSNLWQSLLGQSELGDKRFSYRSISNMYLHVYRYGELSSDLTQSGFRIERKIPLSESRSGPLAQPWLLGRLRANGWIVVCR